MYATVAKRLWGLDVVGAIYRSYSKRGLVKGVYDISAVGPEQLFGYEDGALCPEAFAALLDETEDRVRAAYGRMADGVFAPDPLNDGVCTYCGALNCERKAR